MEKATTENDNKTVSNLTYRWANEIRSYQTIAEQLKEFEDPRVMQKYLEELEFVRQNIIDEINKEEEQLMKEKEAENYVKKFIKKR